MLAKKLENELKCSYCKDFFKSPRILGCGHSVCFKCGNDNIEKVNKINGPLPNISTFHQLKAATTIEGEHDAISESDSGIFLSHNSSGSLGSDIGNGVSIKSSNKPEIYQCQIKCPICSVYSVFPSSHISIEYCPANFALQSIVIQYQRQSNVRSPESCQLCENNPKNEVTEMCEQCQIQYCKVCRERCHPMRGPLEKHRIVAIIEKDSIPQRKPNNCTFHSEHSLDYFCEECCRLVCQQCSCTEHFRHPIVSANIHAKNSKVALSKSLQRISEKVISGTEFIQGLKGQHNLLETEYSDFIKDVDTALEALIAMIEIKQRQLHEHARQELERKEKIINDQMTRGAMKISQTTSMIHLAVEMIKESNASDFCAISSQTINRALKVEQNFLQDLNDLRPKCNKKIELKLKTTELTKEINNLEFRSFKCPDCPRFIVERCSVWGNVINVAWQPDGLICVEKYLLEIDDGFGGPFKTAYCGPEMMCAIENLHFGVNYKLRIKAINEAGSSSYGDTIRLTTSPVSTFRMMPYSGPRKNGVSLSASGMVIESQATNTENTVFLANTGFSKGVHYWEYKVEYYDGVGEPSFGVATENCTRNKLLGSDLFSWGMYLDSERSWFQHDNEHTERTDVHLRQGIRIGIRLDIDNQRLSYFINDQPHGPIAFNQFSAAPSRSCNQLTTSSQVSGSSRSLQDGFSRSKMLFPAVSVSHGIRISLTSGISPPSDDSCSEEEADLEYFADIRTPSLSKKLDVSRVLDGLGGAILASES